ncbi:MAG: DMT family transporter [Desulfobacteraceae bacterium]|nr:DMT family transporter [Desulfobacteraceae bacterium]
MLFPYMGEVFSVLTAVAWAFGVILFKKSGETMHPVALNIVKNLLAFVLIIPTMMVMGEAFMIPCSRENYLLLLASGVLGIGISDTLFFRALNLMGAGLSAIVDCLYSPFVIGLSILFIGETLSLPQTLGAIAIVSAVLVAANRGARATVSKADMMKGLVYGVSAMFTLAVGIVMIKPILCDLPVLWVVQVRLLGGLATLAVYMAYRRDRRRIFSSIGIGRGWVYALSGSVVGYYIALTLWMAGFKYTQACVSAALNQTSTIFIFIFSALFLKEPMNRQRILAAAMGIGGSFALVLL